MTGVFSSFSVTRMLVIVVICPIFNCFSVSQTRMKNSSPWKRAGRTTFLAVAVLFFSAFATVNDDLFLISKNLDIFSAVYRHISVNYVDETDPDKLIKTAVDAMLDELDPYTEFVGAAEVEDYRLRYVDTKYGGVGATIFERNGRIIVSEVYAGHPADEAGIAVGDELTRIDGISLRGKSTVEVSHLLRGADGSEVRLEVLKPDGVLRPYLLTRRTIRQPNVGHTALLDGGIGYIKLDKFLEHASLEVESALRELNRDGRLNGLVLDLRSNGGGILQEAVRVVNLFVPEGELVVSQRGKNAAKGISYPTLVKAFAADLPLAVLINGQTASAAEIVAGALQDLDRAVIVGERSFGKGLVQQTFNLPYNNLVKVTVAKYYTPSGRCIQAVDYVHRDSSGRYRTIPDSVIHSFHTKNGRTVFDGSGVFPDLEVTNPPHSPITRTLLDRHLIFDYATHFRRTHKGIADAGSFVVDDLIYSDFMEFLKGKDYQYLTKTEALVRQLKQLAGSEWESPDLKAELEQLENRAYQDKQRYLLECRDEIGVVLGKEIVARFHYREGRYTYSQRFDRQLKRALALFEPAANEYYSILSGEGTYKMIGRPAQLLAVTEAANE